MSEHRVEVEWARGEGVFDRSYDRSHIWRFDSGVEVPASSAPDLLGDPSRVDPEEAFVASISSCHMLWFLYMAATSGYVVDAYRDAAVGHMRADDSGVVWITDVEVHPDVDWGGEPPTASAVDELHHRSHARCFIANSVRSNITVVPCGGSDAVA